MADNREAVRPAAPRRLWGGLTFSIRQLLAAMGFIAVGCVALARANDWWGPATFGLSIAALTVGVLLAIYRDGPRRAFWVGFCLCGWVYTLLLLYAWHVGSSKEMNSGHPLRNPKGALVTSRLTRLLYDRLYTREVGNVTVGFGGMGSGMGMAGGYGSSTSGMPGGGYGVPDGAGDMPGGEAVMPGGYGGGGYGGYGTAGTGSADGGYGGGFGVQPTPAAPTFSPPSLTHFMNVGHSLWTILIACLGGWIGHFVYSTGQRSTVARPVRADDPTVC